MSDLTPIQQRRQTRARYALASSISILVSLISGAMAVMAFWPNVVSQILAGVATVAGIVARWCEQHVPSVRPRKKTEVANG